jgi:hypothetical protein
MANFQKRQRAVLGEVRDDTLPTTARYMGLQLAIKEAYYGVFPHRLRLEMCPRMWKLESLGNQESRCV